MAPLALVAHSPGLILPWFASRRFVQGRVQLDPAVRALARQLVSTINGCAWCLEIGRAEAVRAGVPTAKLLAVAGYATDPRFSPAERAALAYAAAATQVGARVPDDVFGLLHCYFTDREILELAVTVAMENFDNRITVPLGIGARGRAVPSLGAARAGVAIGAPA